MAALIDICFSCNLCALTPFFLSCLPIDVAAASFVGLKLKFRHSLLSVCLCWGPSISDVRGFVMKYLTPPSLCLSKIYLVPPQILS